MKPLGKHRTHFWLTLGMARACEVDLVAALNEGVLSPEDYSNAIAACRGCDNPEGCKAWLHGRAPGAEPPDYCRNAALFEELRAP